MATAPAFETLSEITSNLSKSDDLSQATADCEGDLQTPADMGMRPRMDAVVQKTDGVACACIMGTKVRIIHATPLTFTPRTQSQSSSVAVRMLPAPTPAWVWKIQQQAEGSAWKQCAGSVGQLGGRDHICGDEADRAVGEVGGDAGGGGLDLSEGTDVA